MERWREAEREMERWREAEIKRRERVIERGRESGIYRER